MNLFIDYFYMYLLHSENSYLYSDSVPENEGNKSINTVVSVINALYTESYVKAQLEERTKKTATDLFEDDYRTSSTLQPSVSESNLLGAVERSEESEDVSSAQPALTLESITIPPHRDSCLSWLLMDVFGGNSLTYVIGGKYYKKKS